MGSRDDLPAVPNAAVDLIACDTEVWCKPSRTTLIGYLAVQRVTSTTVISLKIAWQESVVWEYNSGAPIVTGYKAW